jgi:hypothetical protein
LLAVTKPGLWSVLQRSRLFVVATGGPPRTKGLLFGLRSSAIKRGGAGGLPVGDSRLSGGCLAQSICLWAKLASTRCVRLCFPTVAGGFGSPLLTQNPLLAVTTAENDSDQSHPN